MELYEKYKTLFDTWGVNTPLRKAHFMGQCENESGFKLVRENENYRPEVLGTLFKKYFPTIELCNKYAHNQQAIANRIYANRMGNGDEASGDGWRYRSGGFIGTTGKSQYEILKKETGIDFVGNPDLILTEGNSLIAALHYWKAAGLNAYADKDDCDGVSDMINIGHHTPKAGDAIGYAHRKEFTNKWKKKLGI